MVSRSKVMRLTPEELCLDTLPSATRKAFLACTSFSFLPCSQWYLAGGTALALRAGHRASRDLDFFTHKGSFRETNLERMLLNTNLWNTSFHDEGTLYGEFMKTKMSFIAYPFFQPSAARLQCGTICILKPEDIAVMKIIAISQRGRKRDFVDLYWYCKNREQLIELVKRTPRQYRGQERNLSHILKNLAYFVDADNDPMPEIFFKASWRTIKMYFRREVPKVAKELLGIKT